MSLKAMVSTTGSGIVKASKATYHADLSVQGLVHGVVVGAVATGHATKTVAIEVKELTYDRPVNKVKTRRAIRSLRRRHEVPALPCGDPSSAEQFNRLVIQVNELTTKVEDMKGRKGVNAVRTELSVAQANLDEFTNSLHHGLIAVFMTI